MKPHEQWRAAVGWEGLYEVSDHGRVRSIARRAKTSFGERTYGGKRLRHVITRTGYPAVNLTHRSAGRRKQVFVHHLVLEAFVGPRPDGLVCCHNDSNPMNTHVSNLRWDTAQSNIHDQIKRGTFARGQRNGNSRTARARRAAQAAA